MPSMIHLGIANQETWGFFNDIYNDLKLRYITTIFNRRKMKLPVFNERINRFIFHRDLKAFLQANDVVFFEWASELLATATHLPKVCGIITRLHRYELYDWSDKINWDAVDKIILVSNAKKREFLLKFPGQASKIVVLPPSISLERFSIYPKKYSGDIGILCHISPRKRVYDLILSFYELLKINDSFHLHIAGETELAYRDYHTSLLYLMDELNLEKKVTFYGQIKETWDWYHKIDILISNSYSEGLQVAPMEAMACGCYCLSHHWDGSGELLPEDQLYFTGKELIEKIIRYSELPDAAKQAHRERMRDIAVEKFDIRDTIDQIKINIDDTAQIGLK